MNITCVKCGNDFSIKADQLGTRGKCPHCRATIILPKAESIVDSKDIARPSPWFEISLSTVGSVLLHVLVLAVLLLIPWGGFRAGDDGEGEIIQLGTLDEFQLTMSEQSTLTFDKILQNRDARDNESNLQNAQVPTLVDPFADQSMEFSNMFSSGGLDETSDLSASIPRSLTAAGSENFGELVNRLKRDGLDIVITFDSTGSMEGEIQQVKSKIERMGSVLLQMIPKTRISVCTYRDVDDKYIVKGLPLTSDLTKVIEYLEQIDAGGGRDIPEAVDAGLGWSIEQNSFRPRARKIILLFGDAPPHRANYNRCLRLAADFRDAGGIVSTVTCHSQRRLPAFVEISKLGGGEAFLTQNEREIMSQLVVLVFGSKHRDKVLEAFSLMGQ